MFCYVFEFNIFKCFFIFGFIRSLIDSQEAYNYCFWHEDSIFTEKNYNHKYFG